MEQKNHTEQNVTEHPLMQSISQNIGVISILLIIFVAIGCIAFFSYEAAYSTKIQERRKNAMLYEDSLQNNILGAQDMPEVEIFKPKQQQQQAQNPYAQMQQQQQAQMQQSQGQTMLEQKKQAREAQKAAETEPTKKPSPTKVPEGTFVHTAETISFKLPTGWKQSRNSAFDSDSVLSATVQIEETDKSVEEFIKNKPFGREPKEWEKKSLDGSDGQVTKVYSYDPGGAPVRSISAFVKSKDEKEIIGIHVETKNLDVNDTKLEDLAKEIQNSIKLIEKKED